MYTCSRSNYKAGIKNLVKYPDNTGITGAAFQKNSYIISLKGKKEKNFHELDNIESYGEIKNFIFMPMYTFNDTKNGVIQLFNKKQGKPDDQDIQNIKPYQKLIGIMIQNSIDINRVIDIEMNIKKIINFLKETTTIFQKEEFRYTSPIDDVKIAIENMQKYINDNVANKERIITTYN